MLPRACSRVPALTSVVLYQDLKSAASVSRASAELTILGVNRESSKSGFLLGNPLYHCLHLLGFCNFDAGFSASSSLQMALQERLAFLMGFVKREGEKEVGSWTSLTSSNLVSVIQVAKIVESAKKGVQLQKGSAEKLGIMNEAMKALVATLSSSGGEAKLAHGLSLHFFDLEAGPSDSTDVDVVLRAFLKLSDMGPCLSTQHFSDAGALAVNVSKAGVGAGNAGKRCRETDMQGKKRLRVVEQPGTNDVGRGDSGVSVKRARVVENKGKYLLLSSRRGRSNIVCLCLKETACLFG